MALQDSGDSVDVISAEPMAVRPYGYCETAISSWGMVTSTFTLLCVGPESIETMYSVVFRVVKLLWLDQQREIIVLNRQGIQQQKCMPVFRSVNYVLYLVCSDH